MKATLERFSLEYDEESSTARISISPQANGNVLIPRTIKYQSKEYLITGINNYAFRNNLHVKGVIFPRDSAVKIIKKFAFAGTNIENIILPASVEKICEGSFSECNNLVRISFDSGSRLRTIEKDAFSWSSLHTLDLPANVTDLNEGWCNGTNELVQFSIPKENKKLSCIDTDFIVGKSKRQLNYYDLLIFARRDIENAFIPSSIRKICAFAFHKCSQLKSIQLSKKSRLRTIDQFAFSWASLPKIDVPDHVKKISQFAFSECPQLRTVEFTDKSELRVIKEYAFSSSSIERIKIPSNVHLIGKKAFSWCNHLKIVTFADKSALRSICKNVFHRTLIESISIPSQISRIGEGAFSECTNLKTLIFSKDSQLKSIEKNAFYKTSLENILMPSSLKNLNDGWSWGTSNVFKVTVHSLNENFESIQNDFVLRKSDNENEDYDTIIFARKDTEYAVIPSNIKKIAAYAFEQCKNLKTVTFELSTLLFDQSSKSVTSNSEEEEEQHNNNNCKKIALPEEIDDYAFSGCVSLHTVEFLGDQICIGQNTFCSCKNLRAISLPNAHIFSICLDSFKDVPIGFNLFIKAGAEFVYN